MEAIEAKGLGCYAIGGSGAFKGFDSFVAGFILCGFRRCPGIWLWSREVRFASRAINCKFPRACIAGRLPGSERVSVGLERDDADIRIWCLCRNVDLQFALTLTEVQRLSTSQQAGR